MHTTVLYNTYNLGNLKIQWSDLQYDFCDNSAVLYFLSYQASWELIMLCVHVIAMYGEDIDAHICMIIYG